MREVLQRLGAAVAFDALTPTRAILGPLQPGDVLIGLRLYFASTNATAFFDDITVAVFAHDQRPVSTNAGVAAGRPIHPAIALPTVGYLTSGGGAVGGEVLSLDLPLLHVATERGRYIGVTLECLGDAFTGGVWLLIHRPGVHNALPNL